MIDQLLVDKQTDWLIEGQMDTLTRAVIMFLIIIVVALIFTPATNLLLWSLGEFACIW